MFLHTKLENRKEPIRIAFIGCGKFVSMFLAQYNHLDKIQIDSIVDLNIEQAKRNCSNSGLNETTINEITEIKIKKNNINFLLLFRISNFIYFKIYFMASMLLKDIFYQVHNLYNLV